MTITCRQTGVLLMEFDFSKIELLPHQLKFLKQLKRHGPKSPGTQDISDLFESDLVQPSTRCRMGKALEEVEINKKGQLFLKWRLEDSFRHRWPVYVAIAALFISAAAFIKSFFF